MSKFIFGIKVIGRFFQFAEGKDGDTKVEITSFPVET
uniref:Uncharacterized protein n=1 Tax=Rhizophora mucronata TaxID=61149 RepID=A0A2P2NQL7_RHIMU